MQIRRRPEPHLLWKSISRTFFKATYQWLIRPKPVEAGFLFQRLYMPLWGVVYDALCMNMNQFSTYFVIKFITRLKIIFHYAFNTFIQILIISYLIIICVKTILKMYSKFIGNILINHHFSYPLMLICLLTLFLHFAFHDFQNPGILLFRKWQHISSYIVSSYDK